ncbi:MAG: hypothetical protein ACOYNI_01255 [Acidimicrobiia bacterium]
MRRSARPPDEGGFAAAEMVVAIGLLLIPTIMLVAGFVRWPQQQAAARSAAAEVARSVATAANPRTSAADQQQLTSVARDTANQYRQGAGDAIKGVEVSFTRSDRTDLTNNPNARGAIVQVKVTYQLPVLSVPTYGPVGVNTTSSETAEERIDDYRSIG